MTDFDPRIKAAFRRHMNKLMVREKQGTHPSHSCYREERTFKEHEFGWGTIYLWVDLYGHLGESGRPEVSVQVLGSEGPLGTYGSCDGPQSIEKYYFDEKLILDLDPQIAMKQFRKELPDLVERAKAVYEEAEQIFEAWEKSGRKSG